MDSNAMYRKSRQEDLLRITGQAIEWLRVMRQDPGAEDRAAFTEWVTLSQEHLKEFLVVSMLDRELVDIDPQRKFHVEQLLEKIQDNVATLPEHARGRPPRHVEPAAEKRYPQWRWAASIAMLAVLSAALWGTLERLGAQQFETDTSEQRKIELPDGSTVELNARSDLKVRYSAGARELVLREGEALFKVARDVQRPFRVHSGGAVIEAVGTQFNVNRRQSGTVVAVLEGRVKISTQRQPADLVAGQSVMIASDGHLQPRAEVDTTQAISWRQRRLHFQGETLAEIAEEFNRCNERQIEIEDAAAAARHFNGVFDADDPASFVEFLQRAGGLDVSSDGRRFAIRSRAAPHLPEDR